MKKAKKELWLMPNEICIAHGNAGAKNLMFESRKNHKLFLKLWDKYLGGMTEVINYHLAPDSWTILFKAKKAEEIKEAYKSLREKSKKAKRKFTLTEPKRMLSEHIRIFLSQYVRTLNRQLGRKGSLVMERFRKYIIKKHADYMRIFNLLTQQVRFKAQPLEKYQADESQYDVASEMRGNCIWRVGKKYYEGGVGLEKVLGCLRLVKPDSYVLRNFFNNRKANKNSS